MVCETARGDATNTNFYKLIQRFAGSKDLTDEILLSAIAGAGT